MALSKETLDQLTAEFKSPQEQQSVWCGVRRPRSLILVFAAIGFRLLSDRFWSFPCLGSAFQHRCWR
jgi:hypothetical protein